MNTTTIQTATHTIDLPGVTLTYDVRRNADSTEPPLMLVGSPMGAAGFTSLAAHFPDRTLVTYDPRGSERSVKEDPTTSNSTEDHVADLHRIIEEVGSPVDLFGSSGGAINALALAATHPEDVRIVVAHEPPLATALPDREHALAAARAVQATYMERGFGAGMAHFIAVAGHQGEFPAGWADQPPPDPAAFGMPTEDDGTRTDVLLAQNMIGTTHFELDFEALRAAPVRVVIAAGAESGSTMASRAAFAVAQRLGTEVAIFPSHHGGFLGGEYGQHGDPPAFAAKLREVLEGR